MERIDDDSIFYTTRDGNKYPIMVLSDDDVYPDDKLLNEEQKCKYNQIIKEYRAELSGGIKLVSHTFEDNVGEIRFDGPIVRILYGIFSNYDLHDCHVDCVWLPATVTVIDECIFTDEENITLYLKAKTPPEIVGMSRDMGMWEFFSNADMFKMIYVPTESVELYKKHPVWGYYHQDKIVGYNFRD